MERTLAKPMVKVKRQLHKRGIPYQRVADRAERSWFMVWAVLNGRKKSQHILTCALEEIEAHDAH